MTTEEQQPLVKIVEDTASALAEYFDSVRIFVTKHGDQSDGSTFRMATGRGNYYASMGQIHEYLVMQNAISSAEATKPKEEED